MGGEDVSSYRWSRARRLVNTVSLGLFGPSGANVQSALQALDKSLENAGWHVTCHYAATQRLCCCCAAQIIGSHVSITVSSSTHGFRRDFVASSLLSRCRLMRSDHPCSAADPVYALTCHTVLERQVQVSRWTGRQGTVGSEAVDLRHSAIVVTGRQRSFGAWAVT